MGEKLLNELLPSDEIPSTSRVIQTVQGADTLSRTDQELIGELFDSLETAHDQLGNGQWVVRKIVPYAETTPIDIITESQHPTLNPVEGCSRYRAGVTH